MFISPAMFDSENRYKNYRNETREHEFNTPYGLKKRNVKKARLAAKRSAESNGKILSYPRIMPTIVI
jgi:hypothetical protein